MKRNYLILSAIFSIFLMFSSSNVQAQTDETQTDLTYHVGDLVEASDYRGVWYQSKIVGVKDGKYRVHFFGWSENFDETVPPERIRDSDAFVNTVEVSRKGVWEKGYLVSDRYGTEHLVYYVDSGEEEWVKNERIRDIFDNRRDGKIVEVQYGKKGDKWLRAVILRRRAGEVYVHYEDTDDIWNEWVSVDKIRRAR